MIPHTRVCLTLAAAAAAISCARPAPATSNADYDLIIANGKIVDGTGNPWYYGDVGVRGDRIAAVVPRGALASAKAKERIDASGLAVSPGFIDIQAHS